MGTLLNISRYSQEVIVPTTWQMAERSILLVQTIPAGSSPRGRRIFLTWNPEGRGWVVLFCQVWCSISNHYINYYTYSGLMLRFVLKFQFHGNKNFIFILKIFNFLLVLVRFSGQNLSNTLNIELGLMLGNWPKANKSCLTLNIYDLVKMIRVFTKTVQKNAMFQFWSPTEIFILTYIQQFHMMMP